MDKITYEHFTDCPKYKMPMYQGDRDKCIEKFQLNHPKAVIIAVHSWKMYHYFELMSEEVKE
jgi:hypothetical protein